MQNSIQWTLACSGLEAFQVSLPGLIDEDCVSAYHDLLRALEEAGHFDLVGFRVAAAKLEFRIVRARSTGLAFPPEKIQYSNKRYCDRDYFSAQLENVLHFIDEVEKNKL